MNENSDTEKSSISKGRTPEEIADYWDSHSLDIHWEQTYEVGFEMRAQQPHRITVDPETSDTQLVMPDSPKPEPESQIACVWDYSTRTVCAEEPFYKEHEGKRYCVLHFPGREKISDFAKALHRKLQNADYDFRGVWFPYDMQMGYEFKSKADFREATFDAPVYFNGAIFRGDAIFSEAKFSAVASFNSVSFEGLADFTRVSFAHSANFGEVKFGERSSFLRTDFKGVADFSKSQFSEDTDFWSVVFEKLANFQSAFFAETANFNRVTFASTLFEWVIFSGNTNFEESEFQSHADFFTARFEAKANFHAASFYANVDFSDSTFGSLASFNHVVFGGNADFSDCEFGDRAVYGNASFRGKALFADSTFLSEAIFTDAIFRDYVKFAGSETQPIFKDGSALDLQFATIEAPEHVSFHTLSLRPHCFANVDPRKFDLTYVDWDWHPLNEEIECLKKRHISSPYRVLAIACRRLAVNSEENQRYGDASRFRYMAMDAKRRTQGAGFAFWRLGWWYWLASGYGERVWQAALVLITVWFMFAAIFFIGQGTGQWWRPTQTRLHETTLSAAPKASAEISQLSGFREALVYSAGVMTLQKPEPLPANKRAKTLVLLETILGPVQAAMLALAIRRKFMR